METKANLYYIRALEAYPYELEKVFESLQYALSYEPENAQALCLMARAYGEALCDRKTAITYFEAAMVADMDFADLYPPYIRMLMVEEDFNEAQKLIDFAKTIKGTDKATLQLLAGQLFEMKMEYERSEEAYKEALDLGMNTDFIAFVESELGRVTKKRERRNNKKVKEATEPKKEKDAKNNWLANRLNNLL